VMVRVSDIRRFLAEKGFRTSGPEYSTFFSNTDSTEVDLHVDSEWIDLNHLVQDWTTIGAQTLADELLVCLGFHNY
jgi:hypothetical protein